MSFPRPLVLLKQFPLTITLLVLMLACNVAANTVTELLRPAWQNLFGFSPADLWTGDWYPLFSSLLLTTGRFSFYASFVMLAVCVGFTERRYGTLRTLLTFLGVHVVTLLMLSVLVAWPLVQLEFERGHLLFNTNDVGPSAGYYGCLGLLVMASGWRGRKTVFLGILLLLLVRASWTWIEIPDQTERLTADVAHLIAFPLGALSFWLFPGKRKLGQQNAFPVRVTGQQN